MSTDMASDEDHHKKSLAEKYSISELPGQTHRGKPCCGVQGFPMELTPRVIPCCIVRIFEECMSPPCNLHRWAKKSAPPFFIVSLLGCRIRIDPIKWVPQANMF